MDTIASPSLAARLQSIGVAAGYAYDLANKNRTPSDKLAIRIYRELGVKMGALVGATDEDIAALERMKVA